MERLEGETWAAGEMKSYQLPAPGTQSPLGERLSGGSQTSGGGHEGFQGTDRLAEVSCVDNGGLSSDLLVSEALALRLDQSAEKIIRLGPSEPRGGLW